MADPNSLVIRRATLDDGDAVWRILEPVIRAGETYALPRTMTKEEALAYWLGMDKTSFVAEEKGAIVGTYYLRANQQGGGDHVCNCGYVTSEQARKQGVARLMCEHSFHEALKHGFRAMQYNSVVSTNHGAVRLWTKLGFEIVGTLPGAFCHPTEGDVDAYVMFKAL
jgi:L-amino acid N-acyltransferase YncA